jgi:hypothetical protein
MVIEKENKNKAFGVVFQGALRPRFLLASDWSFWWLQTWQGVFFLGVLFVGRLSCHL